MDMERNVMVNVFNNSVCDRNCIFVNDTNSACYVVVFFFLRFARFTFEIGILSYFSHRDLLVKT